MKIIIASLIFLIVQSTVFSGELKKRCLAADTTDNRNNNSLDDSQNETYYSYSRINFSLGWQSQFKPLVINSRLTFNLNYNISNFYYPIQISPNQIGLYNEIGVNNLSVFTEAGPELRLLKNIYLIPNIGVSFAWIAGIEKSGLGFIYFYGIKGGYFYPVNKNLSLYLEGGADFIPIEETQGIYFGKIGISLNLF